MVTGSCSAATSFDNSPAASGLRMVAMTVCPARAKVTAVASPMPLLAPVISMFSMIDPSAMGSVKACQDYYTEVPR